MRHTQSSQSSQPAQPFIALSAGTHRRLGERRTDAAWMEETWSDPATRVLAVAGTRFPVRVDDAGTAACWVGPAEAPEGTRVLLGDREGTVYAAVLAGDEEAGEDWVSLRAVLADLVAPDADLVAHAVALAEWHRRHRYCPRCGGSLAPGAAGHVLTCSVCGRDQFPRTDPAVIMAVTDAAEDPAQERCLLARQPQWPEGRYSTLAGFVEAGESMEDAVRREVAEEVGVRVGEVRYVGNQPWPFPGSLMVGFLAHAETTGIAVDGDEISHARWFTREQLRAETDAGTLVLPGGVSISRSLIEGWYGGSLPGRW